uniref:Uncharacterized protein n=1 Tax=Oryza brachyantha TaxID=4533 RepID=J3MEL2_ORYBR
MSFDRFVDACCKLMYARWDHLPSATNLFTLLGNSGTFSPLFLFRRFALPFLLSCLSRWRPRLVSTSVQLAVQTQD